MRSRGVPGKARAAIASVGASAIALLFAAAAAAGPYPAGPIAPYNGHNPFNCTLQDVGTGTDFPDPDVDPLCVEFDKTQQNVTDFGLVDFLANEPARVAAALPKCFYFQHDHWTGSVVQGTEPEVWHWDGSYFFDRARGVGGVHVANFRIGGVPFEFTPYAPPEYQPYLHPGGGGGVFLIGGIDVDPSCAPLVDSPRERAAIYYHRLRAAPAGGKRIGRLVLGELRQRLVERVGPPHRQRSRTLRWDAAGGGELRAAFRGTALDRRVAGVLSTSPRSRLGRTSPESQSIPGHAATRGPIFRVRGLDVYAAGGSPRARYFFATGQSGVRWVSLIDRRAPARRALLSLSR